jgi:hypothetical protein
MARESESRREILFLRLKRAAKMARKTAKMYGTPLYFWKNGKVVAEKP